jgi:hypothetical protein
VKIEVFGMKNTQKRHVKHRDVPEYRRIKVYSKGKKQYWKERSRRKQVYRMFREGKDLAEMAAALGVCERTIQRDLVKLGPYIQKVLAKEENFRRQAQLAEIKKKSPAELLRFLAMLTKRRYRKPKPSQRELYDLHNRVLRLDCDTPNGIPKLLPVETTTKNFMTPFTIVILAIKNGKPHGLGSIKIG